MDKNLKETRLKGIADNYVLVYEKAFRNKSQIVTTATAKEDNYTTLESEIVQLGYITSDNPFLEVGDKPIFNKYSEPDTIFHINKYENEGKEYVETLFIFDISKITAVE